MTLQPLIIERGEIRVEQAMTPEEMAPVQDLQREIWGYGEPGADFPYPTRALFSLAESGGLVSVARVREELAGFAVAWLGLDATSRGCYLHSQLLGVRPRFRRRGVAFSLKIHQAHYARSRGLRFIRWTFDPLRAQNARFNLHRLGAVAGEYREDYYGNLQSRFQAGDPSDRLLVVWDVESSRVEARLAGDHAEPPGDFPLLNPSGSFEPDADRVEELLGSSAGVRLAIPAQIDALRLRDPAGAGRWRLTCRRLFQAALQAGFVATDFTDSVPDAAPEEAGRLRAYVLEKVPAAAVFGRGR
ncbi:MAG: GNAT family N-acetyltransferase [Acidobacteriota bacterium]